MMDRQLEAALDRLDKALSKAEAAAEKRLANEAAGAGRATELAAEMASLEARHGQLKEAVAQGLRQLDDILGGMGK